MKCYEMAKNYVFGLILWNETKQL